MFWPVMRQIVGKLLLKATVLLVLVLGVLSYGQYLRGGDPGALWKSVAGNGVDRFVGVLNGSVDGAKRTAQDAIGSLGSGAAASGSGSAEKTDVYTWKDTDGVTHFSQQPPADATARMMTVDPNVNVLAPVGAPNAASTRDPDSTQAAGASARRGEETSDDLQAIGGMPGIAGLLQQTR